MKRGSPLFYRRDNPIVSLSLRSFYSVFAKLRKQVKQPPLLFLTFVLSFNRSLEGNVFPRIKVRGEFVPSIKGNTPLKSKQMEQVERAL